MDFFLQHCGTNIKKNAEEKRKAYRNAQKFNIVSPVSKSQKKKNDEQIENLKREQNQFERKNQFEYRDFASDSYEVSNDLKNELAKLKRQRSRFKASLSLIDQNQEVAAAKLKDKINDLRKFFPNANIREIEDVENFHNGLREILSPSIQEAKKDLLLKVKFIDGKIEELYHELEKTNQKSELSSAAFRQYARNVQELNRLKSENESYEKSVAVESDCRTARSNYTKVFKDACSSIQGTINERIKSSNEFICGENVSVPKFEIQNPDRYSFVIENDEGSGSNDRSLLQFHLAVLQATALPILIEDSVNFSNIADQKVLKLLELFSQSSKQIFIAIDKAKRFSDDFNIPPIIKDNVVLQLSKGKELFGRAWNVTL